VPTNKQRRLAAQRKLARQLEHRREEARRRRKRNFAAGGVFAAVVVVVLVVLFATNVFSGSNKKAAATPTPSSTATSAAPTPTATASPFKTVSFPKLTRAAKTTSGPCHYAENKTVLASGTAKDIGLPPDPKPTPNKGTVALSLTTSHGAMTFTLNRADAPWRTLRDLLDYARSNPDKVRVGNSGAGSHTHFASSALFITGGGYHDYERLVPHLTTNLSALVQVTFVVKFDLDALKSAHFADAYDLVVYDVCFDEADGALLHNALSATRIGKPAVMIHCAVHAFRRSERVREWENCCGMRSKVHDPFQPFTTQKLDPTHPVLKDWPAGWKTPGDELYQTIELLPGSHPLLSAKSPPDQRESKNMSRIKGRAAAPVAVPFLVLLLAAARAGDVSLTRSGWFLALSLLDSLAIVIALLLPRIIGHSPHAP